MRNTTDVGGLTSFITAHVWLSTGKDGWKSWLTCSGMTILPVHFWPLFPPQLLTFLWTNNNDHLIITKNNHHFNISPVKYRERDCWNSNKENYMTQLRGAPHSALCAHSALHVYMTQLCASHVDTKKSSNSWYLHIVTFVCYKLLKVTLTDSNLF